jgi:WD40 repeat protein/tetratricopeptide (TPR) repeat protein/predicted RNA-binding Zn-ribbon protein involved in translation (DUF1610 family)
MDMSTAGRVPSPTSREHLEGFRRSLRLEAGTVAAEPGLLWQQVSNRLRHRENLAVAVLAEDERRVREGAGRWFRVLSPLAESPQLLGAVPGYGDVAFADATHLVTVGGGTLTTWHGRSGRPTAIVPLAGVTAAEAFSLDAFGRVALVATPDGLQVHDAASGTLLARLEGSDVPPHDDDDPMDAALLLELDLPGGLRRGFCLSADGSLAAGAQRSGEVTVWDATTGGIRSTFPGTVGALSSCAFTPDAATLVFATDDASVLAWHLAEGAGTVTLEGLPPAGAGGPAADGGASLVLDLATAPDGRFVAAVTGDRVLVWDLSSGQARWSAEHFGSGRCCAVAPDAGAVVTGGARGVLRVRDAATGAITGTLAGHTGTVGRCAVSADGGLLASTGPDGARLWALPVGGGSEFFDSHADRVTAIAFDPYDDRLASSGADRRVLLWDASSTSRLGSLDGHEDAVQDCTFAAPDGARLVTAGRDGTVRLWDAATGKEQRRLAAGLDAWWGCAVHPDGTEVMLCGGESVDRVALSSGSRLATYARDTETWRCCYTPDGTGAVLTGGAGRVAFWDAATEGLTEVTGHQDVVGVCAVSPDGRFAVTGGADGTVRVWDLPEHRERFVLHHDAAVWGCAVTADARYVVSTSWDNTVRIWDAAGGDELMRLTAPGSLHGCTAHPWRARVAYGDHTGRVHVVEPAGLPFGPVVTTPVDDEGALHVRCPACGTARDLEQADLGAAYRCSCGLELRVTDRPLRAHPPAKEEADSTAGLARALGPQTPRERVLMYSTKTCTACGHEFELLRHACPQCGSTMATPPDVEALQFMQMRQAKASELVDRGALLFQSGKLDEAESTLREAVEANPWNATAHGNLGVVLLHRDRRAEALEWFEKAVGIDPDVPGGRAMVDRLRAEVAGPSSSEPDTSADDEVGAARAAMAGQDWDAAIQHFGRAIDVVESGGACTAPTFNLYGERATAEAYRGDYHSSLADLDRALQLEPDEWHYLDARARAHYVLGSYDEAVADWSAALEHLPTTGDARAGVLLYRAASYRQLDRPTEALHDLRSADAACADPAIAQGIEDLRRTINSEEGLG